MFFMRGSARGHAFFIEKNGFRRRTSMRTEWLKYFLDIAKSGSLHLSAEKFYISQPALGKAIASLEQELGYPLFDRTNTGMQLTELGRKTLPIAREVLSQLEQCEILKQEHYAQPTSDLEGELNIVTVPTIGTGIMPVIIQSFGQKYPKVRLSILETNTELGLEQLYKGRSDLGLLVVFDTDPFPKEYQYELLWEEQLYAFMRKDNALAKKKSITWNTLKKYPLAIMSYRQDDFTTVEHLIENEEKGLDIALRTNNVALLRSYVLSSDSIGLAHTAYILEREYQKYFLSGAVFIPIANSPSNRFIAIYHSGNEKIPLIRTFIDEMMTIIHERYK